ncbi:protein preY, mitochondrial-like [Choloepus didactylus]|uniref:protein preY, mitochondrial-like n=1 Tax=Choloepus didactylus TaxID=27675 RepID=UPI0018A02F9D|nr:protein preY, mitochondrial-like [Choloepus didactylus]
MSQKIALKRPCGAVSGCRTGGAERAAGSPSAGGTLTLPSVVSYRWLHTAGRNRRAEKAPGAFHRVLLQFLVCLLSKKLLRYEALTHELINEELGIAYRIIDGFPSMIPQAARMTHQKKQQEEMEQHII